MKKIICLTLLSVVFISGFGFDSAIALKKKGESPLNGIDFSVPLNSKEKKIVMDYYNNVSNQRILKKKIREEANKERRQLAKKGNKVINGLRIIDHNSKKKGKSVAIGDVGDIMFKYNYRKGKFYFFTPRTCCNSKYKS